MAPKYGNVKVKLPPTTTAYIERIAKLAGFKPSTVVAVLLAVQANRWDAQATHNKEPKDGDDD